MRLIFMGTPRFASASLAEILRRGHDVVAAYTRAPRPAGRRGLTLTPSPVQELAQSHGIPVLTPATLRNEEAVERFRSFRPEIAVVVAYGQILPPAILSAPLSGCLNVHASLLPRWRGAAPIQRAVMAGDARSGVCVMRMEEGLDTGPVAGAPAIVDIGENETAGDLEERLAPLGAARLCEALDALAEGRLAFTPQPAEGVTYARKIEKSERRIDWTRSAKEVHDHIRGLSPFPGAAFEVDLGRGVEQIKILRTRLAAGHGDPGVALNNELTIACGEGAIQIVELQRAGRGRLSAEEFLRGARICVGQRLA